MAFTHIPLHRSIPAGAGAFLLGYVLTTVTTAWFDPSIMALTVTGEYVDSASIGETLSESPSPWVVGGWLFYNAQLIPTSVPTADALNGFSTLTNHYLLVRIGGGFLALLLFPVLLLVSAGYLTVRTGTTSGVHGPSYAGASTVLGYVPLLVVGAFVLTAPSVPTADSVASPAGLPTVFVGLVYATVAGTIGGTLGSVWN